VERKFEIIGEALNRIRNADPELLERVRDYPLSFLSKRFRHLKRDEVVAATFSKP
jgi:hemerythrin-like domain-containing protein